MKITINSVNIEDYNLEVLLKIQATTQEYGVRSDYDLRDSVTKAAVTAIAEKLILERGADIMSQINNNQLINAVIMKVAGKLSNG